MCPGGRKNTARTVPARSEVESDFPSNGAGRHVVGSAEGGEEVVERDFIRHVDDRDASAPFVLVTMEQIVIAQTEIKKVARRNALGIVVIVLCPWRRNFYQSRTVQ
jgi:hypothetical protein